MRLTYLCDIELTFEDDPVLVRPFGGEEGTAFGQGEGTVSGERVRGTVRWSNHAHRRSDGAMLPDLRGVIATEDGATILFAQQGRTVWSETPEGRVGSQLLWVLFETEDARYRWLNDAFCVQEGKVAFPIARGRGHLGSARIYECVNELL
ncbi:MAG TPA: DUF3237 family protein [Ktedonobacterales bacterium]|jgi:hypothetical protein|nr:DUF3237 family protein [Ktedonobacterales bacterium]